MTTLTLLATAVAASAEPGALAPPRRDRLGFAVDGTIGGGFHAGELGAHAARATGQLRVGLGVVRGRTAALLSLMMGSLSGLEERAPDGVTVAELGFFDLGVEPSLRYELTRGAGLRVHVRGGWRWRWLLSTQEAARTCDYNGGCDGGYYNESPGYAASGPAFAVGVGGRTAGDYWAGFGAELAITHAVVGRPGLNPDLDDVLVTLGLNVALGRGNR